MTEAKNVTMCKAGCKDISVNPDAIESMEAAGYALADGSEAPAAVEETGLTDAEKATEIKAAGEIARKQAKKDGLTKEDTEAAVTAASEEAAAALAPAGSAD
jgi:hypothetical protein